MSLPTLIEVWTWSVFGVYQKYFEVVSESKLFEIDKDSQKLRHGEAHMKNKHWQAV